jgi:hypothetical protein
LVQLLLLELVAEVGCHQGGIAGVKHEVIDVEIDFFPDVSELAIDTVHPLVIGGADQDEGICPAGKIIKQCKIAVKKVAG